jgi:hypothetical protein
MQRSLSVAPSPWRSPRPCCPWPLPAWTSSSPRLLPVEDVSHLLNCELLSGRLDPVFVTVLRFVFHTLFVDLIVWFGGLCRLSSSRFHQCTWLWFAFYVLFGLMLGVCRQIDLPVDQQYRSVRSPREHAAKSGWRFPTLVNPTKIGISC